MSWPTHTDYQDAIQNPEFCFMEEDLKKATIVNDMLGMPKVMSGNFASVYEVTTEDGKHHAIRCFVRQVSNQQVRYNLLTRHLQAISMEHLVGFEFHLRGIQVRGDWYPIVRMDWVRGMPMHVYVDDHVNEPDTMMRLAGQWNDLMMGLRKNQIAHGDLQQGNVMSMDDGQFRLVDYDGMYVPAFGQGRSPELGHSNFQHPRRTPDYYDINLDNFAGLVIYTSFLALAKDPELWKKFHTGDNLILQSSDYKDPRQSPVFERLKKNPDEKVQKLAAVLERACIWPIAQVPSFEATMTALASGTLPEPTPLPATSNAAPEWLSASVAMEAEGKGTRPSPGTRAAPAAPKPATRPAPKVKDYSAGAAETKTESLHLSTVTTPAKEPVVIPAAPPQFNIFGWIAGIIALFCLIPQLQWFEATAVVCGILGWTRADPRDKSKWAALAATVIGGIVLVIRILLLVTAKK